MLAWMTNIPLEFGFGNFSIYNPKQNGNHTEGQKDGSPTQNSTSRHNHLTSLTALSDSPTYLFINSGPCMKRKQLFNVL